MKRYEITYQYEGKEYTFVEQPLEGWEEDFPIQVLNRIESLTRSGAIVTNILGYKE